MMLMLYLVVLLSTASRMTDSDVPPNNEYYVFLNDTSCVISTNLNDSLSTYFKAKGLDLNLQVCDPQGREYSEVNVTEHNIPLSWKQAYDNDKTILQNRRCVLNTQEECVWIITFKVNRTATQDSGNNIPTTTEKPNGTTDSNLYVYVGAGVAVVVLIVLIQTGCIISYRRKVAKARRALENVMHIREEKKQASERYSDGPVMKKTSVTMLKEDDNDLYESLEHLTVNASKGDSDTAKSCNIKERPQLPLPFGMPPAGKEDNWGSIRSARFRDRPPMPLPHEMASGYNVSTLPHRTTQKGSFDRFPPPPANASMTSPRVKPNTPRNFSVNPPEPMNGLVLKSREKIPELPTHANMTSPRVGPNVAPKNPSARPVQPANGKPQINLANELTRHLMVAGQRRPWLPITAKDFKETSPKEISKIQAKIRVSPLQSKHEDIFHVNPLAYKNAPQPGPRDRFADPPVNTSVTALRPTPNLPKHPSPSFVTGKPPCFPVNTQASKNTSSSSERLPEPSLSLNKASPRPGPKVLPKTSVGNIVNELNKVLSKKQILPDEPNIDERHRESYDEEWTYEPLGPMDKYLH